MHIRRTAVAAVLGVVTVGAMLLTPAVASAAPRAQDSGRSQPQDKIMKLSDQCDKPTWDATPGFQGVCLRDAGSVTPDRFTADLARGGNNNWWINNRQETINAGDRLVVQNVGGESHTFTQVDRFGQGIIPPFNAAVPNDPAFNQLGGEAQIPSVFGTIVAPVADNPFGASTTRVVSNLSVGTHLFQCVFHPWMRTVVTVRPVT